MAKKRTIQVGGDEVVIIKQQTEDYISLTDMARYKNAEATGMVISHWLSTRYAVDFLGIWERINNPDFNITEFSNIRMEAGTNICKMTRQTVSNSAGTYNARCLKSTIAFIRTLSKIRLFRPR